MSAFPDAVSLFGHTVNSIIRHYNPSICTLLLCPHRSSDTLCMYWFPRVAAGQLGTQLDDPRVVEVGLKLPCLPVRYEV